MNLLEERGKIEARVKELELKKIELEELILSGNEQTERQLNEAADRQKNLEIKIIEMENEVNNAREQAFVQEEKAAVLAD